MIKRRDETRQHKTRGVGNMSRGKPPFRYQDTKTRMFLFGIRPKVRSQEETFPCESIQEPIHKNPRVVHADGKNIRPSEEKSRNSELESGCVERSWVRSPVEQSCLCRWKPWRFEEEIARLHDTAGLLGLVRLGQESCPGGSLEDFTDTLAGTSRAFKIFVGTNLLSDLLTL